MRTVRFPDTEHWLIGTGERSARRPYGLAASTAGHATIVAIALAALVGPKAVPSPSHPPRLILRPPATEGAALPLGLGSNRRTASRKPPAVIHVERSPLAVETRDPADMVASLDLSPDVSGSGGTADAAGDPNGQIGGVGGCVVCEGDGPVADWDQPPRLLHQTRPVYPQEAFVKKTEGTVVLEILIATTGAVTKSRVLSSVSPELDQAAAETVRHWRFVPALRGGRPAATWARAPVQFRIY